MHTLARHQSLPNTNTTWMAKSIACKPLTSFSFDGRATRSQFWAGQILVLLAVLVFYFVVIFSAVAIDDNLVTDGAGLLLILSGVAALVAIAVYNFALAARRCFDAGIPRAWVFATLLPLVGLVVWIVFGCLQTEQR